MTICLGVAGLLLLFGTIAFFVVSSPILAAVLGALAVIAFIGAFYFYQKHRDMRTQEQLASQQMQEAINQIGLLAARESTMRKESNQEALAKLEQEIRALGVSIPRSPEEAQNTIQQVQQTNSENLAAPHQQLTEQRNTSRAPDEPRKAHMETLSSLRNER